MNIDKANLVELQNEALFNDELYNYIVKEKGNAEDFIEKTSLEDLRSFIGNLVINNSEC